MTTTTLVQPPDLHNLFDDTGPVLTHWRDDEVIAAVMGVAFFSAWKPIFDTFVKEWKAREKGTR